MGPDSKYENNIVYMHMHKYVVKVEGERARIYYSKAQGRIAPCGRHTIDEDSVEGLL